MLQFFAITVIITLILGLIYNIKAVKTLKELGCFVVLFIFLLIGLISWLVL